MAYRISCSALRSAWSLARKLAGVVMLAALLPCGTALAQTYPSKPVHMIVPYAPGGSTDTTARLIAKELATRLGQPFIVENRSGAGGSIGQDIAAKAAADGYTLLFSAAGPLTVTPHTYSKLAYDPIKSFEPIKLIATSPLLLVVNPELKVASVDDLIKLAKTKPGGLKYGSFGIGSAAHLAGELFKMRTGVDMIHIPYKGSAPALSDLLAGQIDLMFDVFVTSYPLAKSGKLRPLAITSDARSPLLPDVPTMAQAGVSGFQAGTWFGVLSPAGVDKAIVDKLSTTLDAILLQQNVRDTLAQQGAIVGEGTPESFQRFFLAEYDKWGKIVKAAGVKAE